MNRKLALAAIASVFMMASGCLGGYEAPKGSDDPAGTGMTDSPNKDNKDSKDNSNPGNPGNPGTPNNPPPPGGNTQSSAKPMFDADVAPIIRAQCTGGGCHDGAGTSPLKFASGPDLYLTVLNYGDRLLGGNFDKTTAQLINKITPGNHKGTTYTAEQVTKIGSWIDAEKSARAGGGSTASPRTALLQKWSGCMEQTDFDAEQLASAWANKQTNEGACQQCHPSGQGFLARNDSTFVFNVLTTARNPKGGYFLEYYFTVDTTTDPANPKIIINKDLIERAGKGTAQHPTFTLTNDGNNNTPTAYARLESFYTKTMAKMTAGTCGAPKLP